MAFTKKHYHFSGHAVFFNSNIFLNTVSYDGSLVVGHLNIAIGYIYIF